VEGSCRPFLAKEPLALDRNQWINRNQLHHEVVSVTDSLEMAYIHYYKSCESELVDNTKGYQL